MSLPFDPDWVVAPGDTLDSWFDEMGFKSGKLRVAVADLYGIRPGTLTGFLAGAPLTDDLAIRLAAMTSIPRTFWVALEQNFRVGLAAGKKWTRA